MRAPLLNECYPFFSSSLLSLHLYISHILYTVLDFRSEKSLFSFIDLSGSLSAVSPLKMPPRLGIKKKLVQRSERVNSVDLHPTEPWILVSLYSGSVCIWNYQSQTMAKSFEDTEFPVRSAKFIARRQWVVAGADDMYIRVYNYNTMDKVKEYEAHTGYIRCVSVHPTLPYVLSSSDDMLIKLWDWEKDWMCTQIFKGHSYYVMQVTFNPKDTNTFASASLDRTIKIWNLGSPDPNFTLGAHLKGVNCVDYYTGGDKPYLITGSVDHTAKVWDYQTETCIQTLEGHTHNVSAVCFHPELPIIITGSEDGTVRIWHSTTYRLENTLNYDLKRVWAVGYMKGSRRIVFGYDEGTLMIKIGKKKPVASMDSSGKILWAKHNEVQTVNIKSVGADFEATDGERLPLAVKETGSCGLYPQSLKHSPNGSFVVVCGDGEYIIYTALGWINRSFGSALEFVWSCDGEYAIKESTSRIKIFSKNFQEKKSVRPTFSAERIYGGTLLAMCSNDFICFYDWAECRLIQRFDVNVKNVYWAWADSGDLVAIASDPSFYMLKYNRDVVSSYLDSGNPVDEQGVKDAFVLLHKRNERVRTGIWVGNGFIYNNSSWRLNYCVGGEVTTMFHLDRPMYLLGYLANQSRIYLIDREFNVMGYTLLPSLIEYKTLVMSGDLERASEVLPSVPKEHLNSVARFLVSGGMLEDALEVATDPEYRFDLAIWLQRYDVAKAIASEVPSESKWKRLRDIKEEENEKDEVILKKKIPRFWTMNLIMTLMDQWEIKVRGKKNLLTQQWVELAKSVSEASGKTVVDSQCKEKIKSLKKEYKEHLRLGTLKGWDYGERMHSLMSPLKKGKAGVQIGNIEEAPEGESERNIRIALKDMGSQETNLGYLDRLSAEEQMKSLRKLVLTMTWRTKSSPVSPKIVSNFNTDPALTLDWDSQSMIEMIHLGKKNINGRLKCCHCRHTEVFQVDWREGFVNLSSFILRNIFSAKFEPPSTNIDVTCSRCFLMLELVTVRTVTADLDWLFLAFTHTVIQVPRAAVEEYLRAHAVEVCSEMSHQTIILKFLVCIIIQLDPMNGWSLMQAGARAGF